MALAVVGLVALTVRGGPPVVLELVAISLVLIVLAALDWWAVGITAWVLSRHEDIDPLADQLERFTFTALAASCFGLLGVNFLHPFLPRSAGFVVLVSGTLLMSAPLIVWAGNYYRRR